MKKRLGKKKWLAKALEVLAEHGIDEIKIDAQLVIKTIEVDYPVEE